MGDLSDLTKHPKFVSHADPLEQLEKRISDDEKGADEPRFGKLYCSDCTHRRDFRPWYSRWFRKAQLTDYFCSVAPRVPVTNSVTGKPGFLPYGEVHSSRTVTGPFSHCYLRNFTGNCRLFTLRPGR